MTNTVDQKEIQQFSKDSSAWWDENGPFKPLHRLNPVRMRYIKAQICQHYGRDVKSLKPFEGLRILDVGCGGGLVCEPMARLGAEVTGADADAVAIAVAREHAKISGLDIAYYNGAAEEILSSSSRAQPRDLSRSDSDKIPPLPTVGRDDNGKFDVVLALEIIEHVSDPTAFVESVSALVKPGGLVIFSTLNRNPKSFLLGIVAAEHIFRWVPRGTHSWKKFIRPSELVRLAEAAELKAEDITGLILDPLTNEFRLTKSDLDVNYLFTCKN